MASSLGRLVEEGELFGRTAVFFRCFGRLNPEETVRC